MSGTVKGQPGQKNFPPQDSFSPIITLLGPGRFGLKT
jgi:hypothetical protein